MLKNNTIILFLIKEKAVTLTIHDKDDILCDYASNIFTRLMKNERIIILTDINQGTQVTD